MISAVPSIHSCLYIFVCLKPCIIFPVNVGVSVSENELKATAWKLAFIVPEGIMQVSKGKRQPTVLHSYQANEPCNQWPAWYGHHMGEVMESIHL